MKTCVTLERLANSVYFSDAFNGKVSATQIAHILEIALKTKLGVRCLCDFTVDVDLGNGHVLHCSLERTKAEDK